MVLNRIIIGVVALLFFQSCGISNYKHCPDHEALKTDLWQLNLTNNERKLIDSNDDGVIENIESFNTQNWILFKSYYILYSMNFDGTNKEIVHSKFSDPGFDYSLSGQDEQIVFVSEYQNYFLNPDSSESNTYLDSRSELLIMDADGSNISTIRIDSTNRLRNDYWKFTNYYEPTFFLDNFIIHRTEIEKYSIDQNFELNSNPFFYDSGIWLTNITSREQQRLTKSSYEYPIYSFDVSNDQQFLTFQTYTNRNVIYLQSVMDSTSANIIVNGRSPQFSPNTKYIGFDGMSEGGIWIYNIQTSDTHRITPEEHSIRSFTFSNDSKWLVYSYIVRNEADRGIAKINVDGTGYQKLADEKDHNYGNLTIDDISELRILYDHNYLVYTASGRTFSICE